MRSREALSALTTIQYDASSPSSDLQLFATFKVLRVHSDVLATASKLGTPAICNCSAICSGNAICSGDARATQFEAVTDSGVGIAVLTGQGESDSGMRRPSTVYS